MLETRARARVSTHPTVAARSPRITPVAPARGTTRAFVTLGGGHGETSSFTLHYGVWLLLGVSEARRGQPSRRRARVSFRLRRGGAAGRGVRLEAVRSAPGKRDCCARARKRDRRSARKPGRAGFEPAAFQTRAARRRRADPPSARRLGGAPRERLSECPFCARNERVESGVSRSSTGRARARGRARSFATRARRRRRAARGGGGD